MVFSRNDDVRLTKIWGELQTDIRLIVKEKITKDKPFR